MKRFRLGILGGGLNSIAGYPHFVASRMDNRFIVKSGVFSRDSKINKRTAEYWGVERIYNDIDSFIKTEKNRIDAVSVLLPTPIHFDCVSKLILDTIPVICEKPLCSNIDEVKKLKNELEKKKGFLTITYNYIAYPILSFLRKFISDGNLGEIFSVHLQMPQESFVRPPKIIDYPSWWRKKDGKIPGILLDLASHLLSLLFYLLGNIEVRSVYSVFRTFSAYKVVDDVKTVIELNNGATIELWVSKVSLGNRNGLNLSVYGSNGSASWVQVDPENLYVSKTNGEKYIIDRSIDEAGVSSQKIYNRMVPGHPTGYIESLANMYFHIFDSLNNYRNGEQWNNNEYVWTIEKEEIIMKILEAMVLSNETKKATLV